MLHSTVQIQDSVVVAVVVQSIPGSAGANRDSNVNQFIQPSVDVIIMSGEDSFSPSPATKIQTAVSEWKILAVTYPCNRLFDAILPATNGGSAPGVNSCKLPIPLLPFRPRTSQVCPGIFPIRGKFRIKSRL